MVRIKPSLCFDLIGDQFDSAEMLPHADYQNSAIPTSPCLPGDVKRENVKYTTGSAQELKGWMHWSIRKKKKEKEKSVPERGAIRGKQRGSQSRRRTWVPSASEPARAPVETRAGARSRSTRECACAADSRLSPTVRGGVRALQRYETERRSIRKTLTHRWENRGGGENAARKWACLESLIGPAEEGTKPPCPMGGRKSPLSIASSPPPPFAISARALVF